MKHTSFIKLVCLVLFAACFAACAKQGMVRDMETMPQDPAAYLAEATQNISLIPDDQEKKLAEDYIRRFFSPWSVSGAMYPAEKVFWGVKKYSTRPAWGENLLPRGPGWMVSLTALSDTGGYPGADYRGITVRTCDMRVMPTEHPHFNDPEKAGEGFPFDNFQNTLIFAGTPVHVSHVSTDRAWVLVETDWAYGWLKKSDVAFVDQAFASEFMTGSYVAVTREYTPLADGLGNVRHMGRIGMILPVSGASTSGFQALVPVADQHGRAVALASTLGKDSAEAFPLEPTPASFARLASQFMGQAYGWGGMFANRDCSATIRDLMAPFGVWLPRNSSQQSKAGEITEVGGMTKEQIRALVLEKGVPWLTVLYRPGHVGLYIGEYKGQPAMLHTAWGLKTRDWKGEYGRHVLGATVITTLDPGVELWNLDPAKGSFLGVMSKMTRIGPGAGTEL